MKSLTDFSMPVFKSFQQEDLIMGVQKPIFIGVLLVFVLTWYLFGTFPSLLITIVVYIPCFLITKHDPHMLTIAISSIFIEPDELEG